MHGGTRSRLAAATYQEEATPPEPVRVLAVVGSEGASSLLPSTLAAASFAVTVPEDVDEAVTLARRLNPHVVLIDLRVTGAAGFGLCRQLRTFSVAYIVMLGGRDDVDRRVGLSVGIDEYIDRLSNWTDVVARLQAMLSRPVATTPGDRPPAQVLDDLTIDLASRTVCVGDRLVSLTPTEFDLLATLVSHPTRVVERDELLQLVWGTAWVGEDHLIDVHMSNLRRKLGDDPRQPKYIQTVRGVGYRITVPPAQGQACSC